MCGCKKKAGPGNKRTPYSPTPLPTRVTSTPPTTTTQFNQRALTNKIPINPSNNAPIALNQNVNINALNNARTNILRRSIYEQARIKTLKK